MVSCSHHPVLGKDRAVEWVGGVAFASVDLDTKGKPAQGWGGRSHVKWVWGLENVPQDIPGEGRVGLHPWEGSDFTCRSLLEAAEARGVTCCGKGS